MTTRKTTDAKTATADAFKLAQDATEKFNVLGKDMTAAIEEARKASAERAVALSNTALDIAQANLNDGFEAARAAMEAKDVREAFEIQTAYFRTVFDRTAGEGRKLTEMTNDFVRTSAEPFTKLAAELRAKTAA
ncbi:MAG: phasin family protein [Alphaproteobacteria bacterium]|uniref:Phasin family protein n=1 Tax=Futiania mangrovi TaxID=2959716 RepID=A0A9J6PB36_9PROT|nr:phasin family protein [Futiania mangrovii]MCP1337332.1 phasin family protein [Futiania mangrovii]MDX5361041.1 phasin family protein [Alphaproteobacteria bacterium]MDX5369195.1 phasin family protein [Alphaproteobacteria bacterium]MDX5463891.1 phasin family protein [Alphaproteobacteria bacterium]